MKIPTAVKPAVWGAVAGAAILAILGFTWGGWVTNTTAARQAKEAADTAVVTALTPICVDKFKASNDAAAKLAELKKTESWDQASFIEKGGWATVPGSKEPNFDLARACANALITPSH